MSEHDFVPAHLVSSAVVKAKATSDQSLGVLPVALGTSFCRRADDSLFGLLVEEKHSPSLSLILGARSLGPGRERHG